MQDLKFRAWDETTHTMKYFDLSDVQRNLFSVRELAGRNNWSNPVMLGVELNNNWYFAGDILMVKWIEDYDDNDNPIYKYKYLPIRFEHGGLVVDWEWYDPECDYMLLGNALDWLDNDNCLDDLKYRVAGNIYENPELLEVQECK